MRDNNEDKELRLYKGWKWRRHPLDCQAEIKPCTSTIHTRAFLSSWVLFISSMLPSLMCLICVWICT